MVDEGSDEGGVEVADPKLPAPGEIASAQNVDTNNDMLLESLVL